MTRFGEKLKAARKKRGLTQKDVAEKKLGITDIAYGDYERGRIYPTTENLSLICNLFEELSFNEMSELIAQEKKQAGIEKTQTRFQVLAGAPIGNATAFVVNKGQELPITIKGDPVLSSDGMIVLQIDMNLGRSEAKLDLIDLRSVKCLKTFDLPALFLNVDVSENPDYKPLLQQMKQQNLKTISLNKSAFAYKIWWKE